jgi:hypothetical protein
MPYSKMDRRYMTTMTAVRKIVDSSALADLFDLPAAFENKRIEVVLMPVEESQDESSAPVKKPALLRLSQAQIEEWAKAPEIQALVGVLKGTGLPENISASDIREMRLEEKYGT